MQNYTCQKCGREDAIVNSRYCATCGPLVPEAEANRIQSKWAALCPVAFLATAPQRLPNKKAHAEAMRHEFKDGRGLLLTGETGTGKSRTAWLLAHREFTAGRTVISMSPMSALEYGASFADGCAAALDWVNERMECDLLVLDDVFKCKFTEAFSGILFAIVDERTQQMRPMLVTTNDTGATLVGRMTDDRGEPMLRRLREFCDVVKF